VPIIRIEWSCGGAAETRPPSTVLTIIPGRLLKAILFLLVDLGSTN